MPQIEGNPNQVFRGIPTGSTRDDLIWHVGQQVTEMHGDLLAAVTNLCTCITQDVEVDLQELLDLLTVQFVQAEYKKTATNIAYTYNVGNYVTTAVYTTPYNTVTETFTYDINNNVINITRT